MSLFYANKKYARNINMSDFTHVEKKKINTDYARFLSSVNSNFLTL